MINKSNYFLIALSATLVFSGYLFSNVYAEESSLLVELVDKYPYYWSQDNFGIDILRMFKAPLTSYLTPGVTDKSTDREIMDAYYKTNLDITSAVIEQYSDRAISYRLHITSPEIFEDVTSYNFQLFNPATNPYEFSLESLASKDKQDYYEFASRYINPGKRPDPFDATIDVITGDGTVLQKWMYFDCKIIYFETYLQDDLLFTMFAGGLESEIRDHSEVKCKSRYFEADMDNAFNPYVNYHQTHATKSYPTNLLNKLPTHDERAMSLFVSFVGSEIPEEVKFQSFQKFGIIGDTIANYDPLTGLSISPQFFLESLVSKDKKGYYEYISRYINPGKTPEPFDVNVDLVAGDGTPILRWQYYQCKVTNFETHLANNLLILKFHKGADGEIRDHTEFQCDGFYVTSQFDKKFSPYVNLQKIGQTIPITNEAKGIIPADDDRAMSFVVHFSDGDFGGSTETIKTFSNFRQPEINEFTLRGLPSQDKNEIYDLIISRTLNPGVIPDRFSVTIDLVAGDETILQKWQYYKCIVTDYQAWLDDDLLRLRFAESLKPEIRDEISFECQGQDLVVDPLKSISPYVNLQKIGQTVPITKEPTGTVPTDKERAISYVVHLSGTDIPQEETFTTFAKFKTHGTTVTKEGASIVYDKQKPSFYLESLPSKDKERFYMLLAKYINSAKDPNPFDVTVDIVAGDTTILQTWQYFDCHIVQYEAYLADGIYYLKYNAAFKPEIRDNALFVCDGFHFETPRLKAFSPYASIQTLSEEIKISNETGSLVPSNNDRPMSYVVHFSNGEIIIPHTYLTFSKYKQTDSTHFWLESLASQDKEFFYDFIIARYINPGKSPELFDVSVDLVTGDGTILQSWQYHKCEVTDFVVYRDDLLFFTRFLGTLDYEIRDKTTFDCAGVNIDIENKIPFSIHSDLFAKGLKVKPIVPEDIVPPHKQLKSGISSNEIECKREMELMIRPSNALPYCVKAYRVNVLQEQGWEHISKRPSEESTTAESKTDSTILQAVLPTDGERAMSYRISVIGEEVPKEIHFNKFSKFAPFTTDDITIDTAKLFGIPLPQTAIITTDVAVPVGNSSISVEVIIPVEDLPLPIPTATIPGDTSTIAGVIPYYELDQKPGFYLESLPSKDKKQFYKWLSRYVNPGKTPDPVDVDVEILDGSGNTLQTWMYRDCSAYSYQIFLEENILMYKYHEKWQSEIKDRVMFLCNGLHLNEI